MRTFSAWLVAALFAASIAHRAPAFSLLGPLQNRANGAPDPWQGTPYGGRPLGLGYSLTGDIGGPMLIQESYRWNIPVIMYGFDPEFVEYFGQAGVAEVEKAITIFNTLPPASELSRTLEEFPLDTRGQNETAQSLQLLDLKSHTLALLSEQLGLAMPERFVWSLRTRNASPVTTNYTVLNMNYDPVTWEASPVVNGVSYYYEIFDDLGSRGEEWASAVEWYQFDPPFAGYSAVAGGIGSRDFQMGAFVGEMAAGAGLLSGQFFTGLSRDDIGGLRFLLNRENKQWETLLPGVTGSEANLTGYVDIALRPGVEKLTFQRQRFDEATGSFHPVTNIFQDIYFANDMAATQTLQRVVTTPDILFRMRDLGGTVHHGVETVFIPARFDRSSAAGWKSHAKLNGRPSGAGPGVIKPPIHITFNNLGRYAAAGASQFTPLWAAIDDSDTPPVWFAGSDTNINSLVVENRLVRTNDVVEFEWTFLKIMRYAYRVETSTNLMDWTLCTRVEPYALEWGNAFTVRHPMESGTRFFRSIKEPWMPPE